MTASRAKNELHGGANGVRQTQDFEITDNSVVGEMAVLYDARRTATITAKTDAQLWRVDRQTFKWVIKEAQQQSYAHLHGLLTGMPLLQGITSDYLTELVPLLVEEEYEPGEEIITQGGAGDLFYIITEGQVEVIQDMQTIRCLKPGEYFGEGALVNFEHRTASCRAVTEVTVATLTRVAFHKFIVPLEALGRLSYTDVVTDDGSSNEPQYPEYAHLDRTCLRTVKVIGIGGFGRVDLVVLENNGKPIEVEAQKEGGEESRLEGIDKPPTTAADASKDATAEHVPPSSSRTQCFALKMISKRDATDSLQEKHVLCEKEVMQRLSSRFCAPLYVAFKDARYVYMLSEFLQGGELWRYLREAGPCTEEQARYYTASVVEGLDHMHHLQIVYRDLKPENLMLTVM